MQPQLTRATPAFISHSPETGSDYTIYIDAPRSQAPGSAVFTMDGDFFFDAAVAANRKLAAAGRIPSAVIVGVGYGAGFGKPGNHRGRDYTPTASADEPGSGGADAFLAFLTQTLWPQVARVHRIREAGRVIAGHSLGSLLVLHALFQERPFFDRALASAPSIWWDNRSILGSIAKLRERRRRSWSGRLYLGAGEMTIRPRCSGTSGLLENQLGKAKPLQRPERERSGFRAMTTTTCFHSPLRRASWRS